MHSKNPNTSISLESQIYKIEGISKKTKAKFWSGLKVGDRLQFKNTIQYVGGASNGLYATCYQVILCGSDPETSGIFTQNEICRYLKIFDLSKVWQEAK